MPCVSLTPNAPAAPMPLLPDSSRDYARPGRRRRPPRERLRAKLAEISGDGERVREASRMIAMRTNLNAPPVRQGQYEDAEDRADDADDQPLGLAGHEAAADDVE